jgi:hypothetical protein
MNAFAAALAVLHADPNLSTAAEYQPAAGGAWTPVGIVLSRPQDVVSGFGQARAVAASASVLAADWPAPARGDRLRLASPARAWKIEAVEPDPLGLSWRLSLAVAA